MIKVYNILQNYSNESEYGLVLEENKLLQKITDLSEAFGRM